MPISAEALPACAAWRDSAPTAAFGPRKPLLVMASATGKNTPNSPPSPWSAGPSPVERISMASVMLISPMPSSTPMNTVP